MRTAPAALIFSRAEARAVGWSDSGLARAVRSGRVLRVRRGYFTSANAVDPVRRALAAAAACTGSVVSHRSAALIHGIPLLDRPPPRPDLTVQPERTGDVAGALLHRARLLPEEVVVVDDVALTSPTRTTVDLGRTVALGAAVVSVDGALNRGLADEAGLRAVIERCGNWPNIRRAIRALELADPLSESPLESVSRLVMRRLQLPAPTTQAVIVDERGFFVGRCDFYWDDVGVFGEADGGAKYDSREVLIGEKLRQERLENLGLIGARWQWNDVRFRQILLAQRITSAFERGRRRDAAGFPRGWSVRRP